MTCQPSSATAAHVARTALRREVYGRIERLSYLPTAAAVAMKLVELGKNLDAEPEEYVKILSADSSMSSKLLALANSPWAGVSSKVTSVRTAVNLLGLGTVRTLAISYCMTGLHSELRLSASQARRFWETALCKAVAARTYANLMAPKLADEAFVAGLFQDLALPLIFSVARDPYLALLHHPTAGVRGQLQRERELFGLDHMEVGRALAEKLALPQVFVHMIACHHEHERLAETDVADVLQDANYVAAQLPHALIVWQAEDLNTLAHFLEARVPTTSITAYIAEVQNEFGQLYTYFHEGEVPQAQLNDLLVRSAREAAENTEALVMNLHRALRDVATLRDQSDERLGRLEAEARCDQLTGVLNRQGLSLEAQKLHRAAVEQGQPLAVGYLDVDGFKAINDQFGHAFGDAVLQTAIATVTKALPAQSIIGRMGGDEFVFLVSGCAEPEVRGLVSRMVKGLAVAPIRRNGCVKRVTLSLGLVFVRAGDQSRPVEMLVDAADELMYRAKRSGGNAAEVRVL